MGSRDPAGLGNDLVGQLLGARVFDLEQPRRMHAPIFPAHWPGLVFALHRRHEPSSEARTSASGVITMTEHSGTHIDALCHQAENLRLYGGTEVNPEVQTSAGFSQLGTDTIEPILKRGVLIDLVAWRQGALDPRSAVGDDELRAAAQAQGLEIAADTVVLVRTGYGAHWDDPERYMSAPGIDGSGSEWLADLGVFAVGIDNMVWDVPGTVDPKTNTTLPGHVILLVRFGIHIIENLFLEQLAQAAVAEFVLVCLPLKFQGGTGCPVRPVALVPGSR